VYWPDLVAIAGFYKDWAAIGGGVPPFMSYGEFPEADIADLDKLYFPRGIVLDMDLTRVHPFEPERVQEFINSSWYEYPGGDEQGLHPYDGETKAKYTGPKPPWEYLQGLPKYSWMKSPRYDGRPMQVGPLARALVGYASGHQEIREMVKQVLDTLQVGPAALFSTLGRTSARGMETVLPARQMDRWYAALVDRIKSGDTQTFSREKWEPSTWPAESKGFGWLDAPRGALGHWVRIKDGKISKYQCVVPSTWNCSPRDGKGKWGPFEASVVYNHPLVPPDQPLEILRPIHSFDPCMSCGVHVLDPRGALLTSVKVQ